MLSNGEERFLNTTMNMTELKNYISNNKWIELHHSGRVYRNGGVRLVPKDVDVQTCNIVSIVEHVGWYEKVQERHKEECERLKIIKEIEGYNLSKWNQIRLNWKLRSYSDDDSKHKWIDFTDEYLHKVLEWVKKKAKK